MINYSRHRRAIESTYEGKCTVCENQPIKDPVTKIKTPQEVPVIVDQPCRLSFKNIAATSPANGATAVAQTIKLFVAPEVSIKPGSKITVTQNKVTNDYQSSGLPAIYGSHQEIILELFKGWA